MKQGIKLIVLSFHAGNIMLVPVIQQIWKNGINFKQKYHLNCIQEKHGAAQYRKIDCTRG